MKGGKATGCSLFGKLCYTHSLASEACTVLCLNGKGGEGGWTRGVAKKFVVKYASSSIRGAVYGDQNRNGQKALRVMGTLTGQDLWRD